MGALLMSRTGGVVAASSLSFDSAFRTARGTSEAAITDGGLWPSSYNIAEGMQVVDAGSLGFPTSNALRIDFATPVARGVWAQRLWSAPPIGGYLCRRIVFRNDHVGSSYPASGHHPVMTQSDDGICCNFAAEWFFNRIDGQQNTFLFDIANLSNGTLQPLYRWRCNTPLTVGTVYQVEERYRRTSSETWELDVRVWNANGSALLFDSSDFSDVQNSAGLLSQVPRVQLSFPSSCAGDPCLENLSLINQGLNFGPASYLYFSGIAVRVSTDAQWVGPMTGE